MLLEEKHTCIQLKFYAVYNYQVYYLYYALKSVIVMKYDIKA